MAITTMLLPSCGITGKGRSKISQKEADSIAAEQELQKKSFFEEFGLEDFQPLPSGWNRPTASERRAARDTTFTAPLEVIPVDTAADTKADTLAQAPSGGRPQRPARPEPPRKETDTETEEDETGGEAAGDEQESTGTKKVDYTAEIMRPIHFTDDSTAFYFLGDVVFYHNGAVITCDSAIRFSEKHMEFYKRVVINSGTTFVYGDRVEYNGEVNLARVYSPIVKVVDQDAVLYTYNFSYNTLTERGRYWGGGTVTQGDNRMESVRGYYDTQTREFTGAGDVELINPDYKMVSDSVRYNLDTEIAEFFTPTRIWNAKGEILLSDRGKYKSPSEDYEFTKNSYILTETQEIWADSMEYFSALDNTVMRRDIQIIDEENNAIAFGDYGEYWGEEEYGFLTIEPSLVSFDPDQPDTLYMRSDSMFFYTYPYDRVFEGLANAVPEDRTSQFEELMERPVLLGDDGLPIEPDSEGEQADEPAPEGSVADPADGDQGEIPAEEGTQAEEGPPDEGRTVDGAPSRRQQNGGRGG
ncbi:MAG: hypothetical protein LIO77_00355, partial [Rikenellaceae bacterium]|nr:hypothetical protein [Rikenellaceae bacterium]